MRILVVRTDRLGDVTLTTPLIRALRKSFPEAHLAALVRAYAEPVLRGNPRLDEVLVDDPEGEHAGLSGVFRLAGLLRRRRFDTALLLLPTTRLAWAMLLAGIPRRIGVGRRVYQVITGTRPVLRSYDPLRSEADYCLDLGRAIGARDDGLTTEVFLSDAERAAGARLLADAGIGEDSVAVGIHPGSGGSAPNWPPEVWTELAGTLLEDPRVHVVLTGGPAERPLAAPFADLPRVTDLVGRLDLRATMGVLARLHVLVSSSTGTMHLAAALGVPTVALFCPLPACHPDLWGPRGNRAENLLPPPGWCGTGCPGDPKACTLRGGIAPAEVAARVLDVLEA
jgi:ADP-heptose:LPS heptosyltransferase